MAEIVPIRGRVRVLLATCALALAVGVAGSLLLGDDEQRQPGMPFEASVEELRTAAANADHPIYWAGTGPGRRFELTETKAGKVFVRYLPKGARVADKRPTFLTVATYPFARAYAVTDKSSRDRAMIRAPAPGGGLAVWSKNHPTSVYLAYPGSDLLVEVYSSDERLVRRLVRDGAVGPVAAPSADQRPTPAPAAP